MVRRRDFIKTAGVTGALGVTTTAGCIGQFGSQPYNDGTVQFMMSPSEPQEQMMAQYAPVRDHLSEELDTEVELNYGSNYSATLQALDSQNGEIAETGPFAAALGVMDDMVDIALQRHAFGTWVYWSVIVTREDSDVEELADLEGADIGFADMTSASGSLYPLYMLQEAGLDIGEAPTSDNGADFNATWTSHAQAFSALQDGQIDAAGVGRFIVWDNDNDDYVEGVRELDIREDIPRAPIVVAPYLSDEEKQDIIDTFVNAPEELYLGRDGEEDGSDEESPDDLWFDDVREASLEKYQPVVDVAESLGISTDLLDEA